MRKTLTCFGVLFVLASLHALHAPALAQAAPEGSVMGAPGDLDTERAEHREMREERRNLREEHSALEAQTEKIKAECVGAKDEVAYACEQKLQALREQRVDLHKRMHEFRAKETAMHQEQMDKLYGKGDHVQAWRNETVIDPTKPAEALPHEDSAPHN